MKLLKPLAAMLALAGLSLAHAQSGNYIVAGMDDLYNAPAGAMLDGTAPVAINVTGDTSITFSVAAGANVSVNIGTGSNFNDADGIGSVSGETNSGTSAISGITSPTAGYIAGVFLGSSLSATLPTSLSFTAAGATSFTSLAPALQQAFYIGDGLTGDGTGTTQTFLVPTGATTLYLGLTDACGYNGGPSCYDDNQGTFSVTATLAGATPPPVAAVPEPGTYALMLAGLGIVGFAARRRDKS